MGELVSRIILTRCFDVCVYKKSTSAVFAETQIKVKDFLKTLLGKTEFWGFWIKIVVLEFLYHKFYEPIL